MTKSLLHRCKEMDALMLDYSDYGACDTEPRFEWKNTLFKRVHKKHNEAEIEPPANVMEWQLYNMPGSDMAAHHLTKKAKRVLKMFDSAPFDEVKQVIDWYGLEA